MTSTFTNVFDSETNFVRKPDNCKPGDTFGAVINGQHYNILCPLNAHDKSIIYFKPPTSITSPMCIHQLFEVVVPPEIASGQKFEVNVHHANATIISTITLTCPADLGVDRKCRFQLPM